jgi:phosphoribosyl 1,2-cyclic phosphate phosphodiesterase
MLCNVYITEGLSMKITILGSGTSTGIPMVGCHCAVCASHDPRDKRTRASILVEHAGKHIVIDTSTDLRCQALREGLPRIDAILFTHNHADHINGIDDLRGFHFIHKQVIPCYGSRETLDAIKIKFGYIFKGLESAGYAPLMEAHAISRPFALFGLSVTPIPLLHGSTPTTGYRIGDVAYLTDCSEIPPASRELLGGLKLLIIDALRYTPHPFHLNIEGALQVVQELQPEQTLFTHLTHEVAHGDGARLPAGITFAYDGMVWELTESA